MDDAAFQFQLIFLVRRHYPTLVQAKVTHACHKAGNLTSARLFVLHIARNLNQLVRNTHQRVAQHEIDLMPRAPRLGKQKSRQGTLSRRRQRPSQLGKDRRFQTLRHILRCRGGKCHEHSGVDCVNL